MLSLSSLSFGQNTPITIQPGTVVIGQCNGHESQPGCVVPSLFGSGGLTLANAPQFPHFAHFVGSAQTTLNTTLSTAIATELTTLPLISPSSGFTYKYDSAAGAFVRTTSSFGPIYTERAETIGRGKFAFGVSYQRFRFSNLDGINMHNIPAVFTHVPGTGPGGVAEPYEADVISTVNSINLNMDQTMLYGTVGLTDRVDLSVSVPIVSVRLGASSDATIIRVSGPTFIPVGSTAPVPNPHSFNNGGLTNSYTSSGSAAGIGDVTFRLKGHVLQSGPIGVALAVDVRTPTGDAREYLGAGAIGVKPFIVVSLAGKHLSPHLNTGYEWNGSSVLAGNITGTTFIGQDELVNGPATNGRLPSQFFYSLGADLGVTSKLTFAADYLGQTLLNEPRVFQSVFITENIPGGTGSIPLPTISGGKDTITLNNGAVGLKYNLFGKLLLTADILFRLDNRGLRQNITPLIALGYAFGQ